MGLTPGNAGLSMREGMKDKVFETSSVFVIWVFES